MDTGDHSGGDQSRVVTTGLRRGDHVTGSSHGRWALSVSRTERARPRYGLGVEAWPLVGRSEELAQLAGAVDAGGGR